MQIHELTQKKKPQVDEGILDTAKSAFGKVQAGIQGAKQGVKQSQIDRKVVQIADTAYNAWTTYKTQLDKYYASSGKPAPANAYSSALMNFVQKNLMGGTSISSATNKADIINLVKQISSATKSVPTQQPAQQPQAQQPQAQQPQAQQPQAQQPQAQQTQQPVQPAQQTQQPVQPAPTVAPVKTQGRVPSTPGAAPATAPRGRAPVTTLKRGTQRPRTVQEAANPQLKQLFIQLVRAASLATPEIDMGDDEMQLTTAPGATNTPNTASGQVPVATTKTPRAGQRYKITKPPQAGQEQPSYYYKYSDGHWENELGDRVPAENAGVLEKYLDVSKGAKVEQDPNYNPQYTFTPNKKPKKGKRK